MSLKHEIEAAYNLWKEDETERLSKISSWASNYREISNNITKLKNDLCRFAQRFDEKMAKVTAINIKTLSCNTPYNLYRDVQSNFICRIAKEGNLILIWREGETLEKAMTIYKDARKKFHDTFEALKTDFKQSKNLVEFFREVSGKFNNYKPLNDPWRFGQNRKAAGIINSLNWEVVFFVSLVMRDVYEELAEKGITLVAEDEEYFNNGTTSGKSHAHTIEPVLGHVKVFPTPKSPLLKEVRQGDVGDCYLLGALMALTKTEEGRKAIKECFPQGINTIETENKIDIRFFYLKNKVKKPVTITVDKRKVITPQSIKDYALWPKLIEKAYTIYRKDGYEYSYKSKSDNTLDGGNSEKSLFAITGKKSHSSSDSDKEKFSGENIVNTIIRKLEKHRAVVCSFHPNGPNPLLLIKDAKTGEDTGIMFRHAYAIVGVNKIKKYFRFVEPNKMWGRDPKTNSKSKEGGHIAISFETFKKLPYEIEYTTGKDV